MSELKKYPNINEKVIREHGLSKNEFNNIKEILERDRESEMSYCILIRSLYTLLMPSNTTFLLLAGGQERMKRMKRKK